MFTRGYWHWLYWLVKASKGRIMTDRRCVVQVIAVVAILVFAVQRRPVSGQGALKCTQAPKKNHRPWSVLHHVASNDSENVIDICTNRAMYFNNAASLFFLSTSLFSPLWITSSRWPYGPMALFLAISEFLLFLALWCLEKMFILQQ